MIKTCPARLVLSAEAGSLWGQFALPLTFPSPFLDSSSCVLYGACCGGAFWAVAGSHSDTAVRVLGVQALKHHSPGSQQE